MMNALLLMLLDGAGGAHGAAAANATQATETIGGAWMGYTYFAFCALLALAGAIATVASPNPIRGAMGLLLMIVSIAGLFLALQAQFLAAIQLIVYAGAVVVLFLFVIMLLGPSATSPPDSRGRIGRYTGAVLLGLAGIGVLKVLAQSVGTPKLPGDAPAGFGSIESLGKILFTEALVPFEISSALLLVAVVGALSIARGRHGDTDSKEAA